MTSELDLVIGSDFVRGEGFHLFKLRVLSWQDIGYYLIGANASDLAAMGASPLGVVVVLRYTSEMTDAAFEAIMEGVAMACAQFGMPLLGGDTGGYESSVLSAAAFGMCPHGKALLRSRGKAGDLLFVTGTVGRAGAALAYFTRGREEHRFPREVEEELAHAWRRVTPALDQGKLLVDAALSQCAIDTSDGLKASCRQLAEASGVDAILRPDLIPVDPLSRQVAEALRVDPLALAVGDSVDFRLVFSTSPAQAPRLWKAFDSQGWELYEIGRFATPRGRPGVYLQVDGQLVPMPGVEWAQAETLSIDELRGGSSNVVGHS
jgi:thiamine-monophosphate kinase